MKGSAGGGIIRDSISPLNSQVVYPIDDFSYTQTSSLGINLKIDYLIPLNTSLDVGIRMSALLLPLELLSSSPGLGFSPFITGRGGLGSLGVYLRMNW
jgi:hypothetical protein